MHRLLSMVALLCLPLGAAVHVLAAGEEPAVLPEFRVEGTPWLYAKLGDMEILTRASPARAREMAAAFVRGKRLYPDFFVRGGSLPMKLILVDSARRTVNGLKPVGLVEADVHRWAEGYRETDDTNFGFTDGRIAVFAMNLAGEPNLWMILVEWANRLVLAQRPAFPEWITVGLFSSIGPCQGVIGMPRSTSVRLAKLSWPDPAVAPGEFPKAAADFPSFGAMFDSSRREDDLSQAERWKFKFQAALFARWSLFGPAKNGRDRRGYWAFAEMARRGQATEAVFRECYGMDWPQACAEMRAYLKPKNLGMLEVRMPHVMADVPEVERMEFRDATLDEVRRIIGDLNRLRIGRAAQRMPTSEPPDMERSLSLRGAELSGNPAGSNKGQK